MKINEIMNSLYYSISSLKEEFNLEISIFGVEGEESLTWGYKIEYNGVVYLAQIKYKKISNDECEEPAKYVWELLSNDTRTEHESIYSAIYFILEFENYSVPKNPKIKLHDLYNYCKQKGKNLSELTAYEYRQFVY